MRQKTLLILILFSLACQHSEAKCGCGSGGTGSYNYLSDPSFNIDMDSYDEFIRTSTVDASAKTNQPLSILLNLNDSQHIDMSLSKTDDGLVGKGNITIENNTTQARASGTLVDKRLSIDLISAEGVLYRFNLTVDGDRIEGDYSEMEPSGRLLSGTAKGKSIDQKM